MLNRNKVRLSCLNSNNSEGCYKIIQNFSKFGMDKICPTVKLTCRNYFKLVDEFYSTKCLKLGKKNKKICGEIRKWFGDGKDLCPNYKPPEETEEES